MNHEKPDICLSVNGFRSYEDRQEMEEEARRKSELIEKALADCGIKAEVSKVTCGVTFSRYEIEFPEEVSSQKVIRCQTEIEKRLMAANGVFMYGSEKEGKVFVEAPNDRRSVVSLKPFLLEEEFLQDQPGSLKFMLGLNVEGKPVFGDFSLTPGILIGGASGTGKSIWLHSMILSLICRYTPEELRLILIDPKRVEFTVYKGLPHLVVDEIFSDMPKALVALEWAIVEGERRYRLLQKKAQEGVRVSGIDDYNKNLSEVEERLVKIVIVVDELEGLTSVCAKKTQEYVQRLSQMAGMVGIYLVVATQRISSDDALTGMIKKSFPARIAFRVFQEDFSRILGAMEAEKLCCSGDFLYRRDAMPFYERLQGAYMGMQETSEIARRIKERDKGNFDEIATEYIGKWEEKFSEIEKAEREVDPIYLKALQVVVEMGSASISLIQRKCGVGYNRAGMIFDWMENMGYIEPFSGGVRARKVLLTKEEFLAKYGKK